MTDEAVYVLYFSHKPLTLNWHKQAPHPSHLPIDTDGFRKRVKGLLLRGTSGESHAAGTEIKANLSLRGIKNFGWSDKQEFEHKVERVDDKFLTIEELKQRIAKYEAAGTGLYLGID